jgi:phosphoribosyl-ATP pyrophosphohydrolase
MTIQELYSIIKQRQAQSTPSSYTASLFASGGDRIAQKVGEEAVEVVIASKNNNTTLLVGEVADLYYHLLVLMVDKNITINEIEEELEKRHAEKTR